MAQEQFNSTGGYPAGTSRTSAQAEPPGRWEDRCAHLQRWKDYAKLIGVEPTQGWLTMKTGWSENTIKACLRRCS